MNRHYRLQRPRRVRVAARVAIQAGHDQRAHMAAAKAARVDIAKRAHAGLASDWRDARSGARSARRRQAQARNEPE
jgi:hypothetical protein